MIPNGATVQWADKLKHKAPPLGVVTARNGRMVEIDARGWWVSEGLLEMADDHILTVMQEPPVDPAFHMALLAERDALQAVVIQQCEAMADMTSERKGELAAEYDAGYEDAAKRAGDEMEALREKADLWDELPPMIEALLSEIMGASNPASLAACPFASVRALAEFVRGGD